MDLDKEYINVIDTTLKSMFSKASNPDLMYIRIVNMKKYDINLLSSEVLKSENIKKYEMVSVFCDSVCDLMKTDQNICEVDYLYEKYYYDDIIDYYNDLVEGNDVIIFVCDDSTVLEQEIITNLRNISKVENKYFCIITLFGSTMPVGGKYFEYIDVPRTTNNLANNIYDMITTLISKGFNILTQGMLNFSYLHGYEDVLEKVKIDDSNAINYFKSILYNPNSEEIFVGKIGVLVNGMIGLITHG